jgi:RND family efflux transporter MFP subunit
MHLSPENDPDPVKSSAKNDEAAMKRRIKQIVIGGAILLAIVLTFGAYTRYVEASDVRTWTRETDVPTVSLVLPQAGGANQPLVLPGTLAAFYDAKIYAQVSGYVKSWQRDIGALVKKGEVLAVIDTPELDQQIAQAKADVSAAGAAQKLSAVTASRWRALLQQDAVARQDVDVKEADLAAKNEALKSAQANLDRLLATKQFARITAPFDGVVTARNLDVGTLVGGSSSGNPLFTVSDVHALRLYVNVPQSYSADIVPGMTVSLTVPEYPGRSFPARLSSSSGAISSQSSTMLVQFEAANADGLLKPGDVAQVSLGLRARGLLRLPASALVYRASGLGVAVVGPGDHVVIKPVTIGVDLGASVMIAAGLGPRDRVINNPPDSIADGDLVRVAAGST